MKIPEIWKLLYQYTYYAMRGMDKQLKLSVSITKYKFSIVILLQESWVLIIVYGLVTNLVFNRRIIIPDFRIPSALIELLLYVFVLGYMNDRMLGSDDQIEHYEKIFDGWSKKKRMLWSFYTYLIAALLFAMFLAVIEVDQHGLNPRNWQWQ